MLHLSRLKARSPHKPLHRAKSPRSFQWIRTASARNFFYRCPNSSARFRRQVAAAANAVTHFPLLWYWLQNSATNPATYDLLLDIGWKLALVLGAALAVEWLVQRAVRKPISMLDARIPNSARTTTTPTLTQDEIASLLLNPRKPRCRRGNGASS